jgi:PST family polysaccharide transporter
VLYLLARTDGVVGVAAGQLLVAAALVTPALLWGLNKVGISPRGVLAVWARPLAGGIVMGAVAWGLHQLVGGGFIGLAVSSSVAIAVYVPFAWPVVQTLRRRPAEPESEPETVPLATATPLPSGSAE